MEVTDNLLIRLDGMRFAFGYSKMDPCHLHTMNELGDFVQNIQAIMKQYKEDCVAEGMSPGWRFSREAVLEKILKLL